MRTTHCGWCWLFGSVLIPKLVERGYKVDVVDLFWFGNNLPRQVPHFKQRHLPIDRRRSRAL